MVHGVKPSFYKNKMPTAICKTYFLNKYVFFLFQVASYLFRKDTRITKIMNSRAVLFLVFNVIQFCGTADDKSYWKRGHKRSPSEMGAESKQSYFQDDVVLSRQISTRSESTARDRRGQLLGSDVPLEFQVGAKIEDGTKSGNVKYKPVIDSMIDTVASQVELTVTKRLSTGRSTHVNSFSKKEQRLSSTWLILNRSNPSDKSPIAVRKSSTSSLKNCEKQLEPSTKLCLKDFRLGHHKNKKFYNEIKREKDSLLTSKANKYRTENGFSKFKNKKENLMDNKMFLIPYLNNLSSNLKIRSKRSTTRRETVTNTSSNLTTDTNQKSSDVSRIYLQKRNSEKLMFPRDKVYSLANKREDLNLKDQNDSSKKKFNKATNPTNLDLVHKLIALDEENNSAESSSSLILDPARTSEKPATELKNYIKTEKMPHKTKRTATKLTSVSKMIHPITDAPLQIWNDDPSDFPADSGLSSSSKSAWPVRRVCEVS